MSLLFFDSFDHYETADITRKWASISFTNIVTTGGRRSSGYLDVSNTSGNAIVTFPASSTVVMGAAVRCQNLNNSTNLFNVRESGTTQVLIRVIQGGHIQAYKSQISVANFLGSSSVAPMIENDWVYIEMKVVHHATTGSVEVKVNGVQVLNLTNQNTAPTGVAQSDSLLCGGDCHYDDLYILNSSGSAPQNDFLGDVQISAVVPNGAGAATQWDTVVGAATHWQAVDESPAIDDATSYIETPTVNDQDLFAFANLSVITGGSTILGVQAVITGQVDSGSANVRLLTRPTSTTFNGASQALGTSWQMLREIWETDPQAVAAWTDSTFNAAEFGVEKL